MTRPLRVLHVVSGDLWAGAEVQAFTLISQLGKMPDTTVAAVLMNDGILAERLRSVGIPVFVLDERENGSLRVFRRMRAVLHRWQPNVVHTHRQKENILGSLANWSSRRVVCVRTVHGLGGRHEQRRWWGVRRSVVDRLDVWCGCALQQKVVVVSRDLSARLKDSFPPGRIAVIENGVDVETIRAQRGIAGFRREDPDCTHIGIAGRLVEVKRVDLFIDAAVVLRREDPERGWRFHIFGDGPMRQALERRAESAGAMDVIRFHGHRQDIATCVGGLDALVICSDHEGLPMIALEAAALGVPTVAHEIGGLPEVVPREFLVSQHDVRGYRDGILRALRADARIVAAHQAAELPKLFSAERNAERIRAMYEQAVAERCTG